MRVFRDELVADMGGKDAVSTQQMTLIEMCVTDRMIIGSIETWLLQQPSLVNRRKKSAYPILLQLASLKDGMVRRLIALGLERRAKPVRSLQDLLQANDRPQT
ncbi:MAG: hypothetical protein NTAFB01_21060 [Nitrospira sp.]